MHKGAIPVGVAGMPPGPGLAATLATVPVTSVPDTELLDVLAAEWRQLAHQQARVWAVLAELANRDPAPPGSHWTPEQVIDAAVQEVRAELVLTRRAADAEVEHALTVTAVPPVAAALAAGELDRRRALVLAEGCADLTGEQAAALLAAVLPTAARSTATVLAQRIRRVAVALDPGWAERRYRAAVHDRRLIGYLAEDGSATITAQGLAAEDAAAACGRVDALAAAAKRAGATARLDQLRADVFIGLLDGTYHHLDQAAIIAHLLQGYPRPDAATPGAAADGGAADTAGEPATANVASEASFAGAENSAADGSQVVSRMPAIRIPRVSRLLPVRQIQPMRRMRRIRHGRRTRSAGLSGVARRMRVTRIARTMRAPPAIGIRQAYRIEPGSRIPAVNRIRPVSRNRHASRM